MLYRHVLILQAWIFSSSCISQVQRLIRNFLWSGGDGRPARAKVFWPVITSLGGLGIVDPACQSRALLDKFIVRGLMPREEPWKELLLHRIQPCTPTSGGPWQPKTRWSFIEMCREGLTRRFEDRPALIQTPPACIEECLRQPLVWNPQLQTPRGHMARWRGGAERGRECSDAEQGGGGTMARKGWGEGKSTGSDGEHEVK